MKALAIDPGERVGWARGEVVDGVRMMRGTNACSPHIGELETIPTEPCKLLRVEDHGITKLWPFAVKLGKVFADYDVVIYETWRLRATMAKKFIGNDFQPVQLIGVIRYLHHIHPHVKLVSQGPAIKSTAEKTVPPDLRARLDALPKAHDECHDYDALLHLHHWFWKRYV